VLLLAGDERNSPWSMAMNDLPRPRFTTPGTHHPARGGPAAQLATDVTDRCESGDFGRDRARHRGRRFAGRGFRWVTVPMSSNYNTRPRVPEVIVDGDRFHVVRRRETIAELMAHESLLPGKK
jgi:diaminopimelate decarboxylase